MNSPSKATNCCPINGVDDEKLACLNGWLDKTVGYAEEEHLINTLNALCKQYGYGRVPQICQQIRDIWYDESKIEIYQKMRKERVEQLEEAKKWVESKKE